MTEKSGIFYVIIAVLIGLAVFSGCSSELLEEDTGNDTDITSDDNSDLEILDPTVFGPDDLQDALDNATGGEVIVLADGNYGPVHIYDRNFTDYVTIRSGNPLGAELEDVEIKNSSNVRLNSIRATAGRESIYITDGSHDIEILNCELYGGSQYDRENPHYSQVTQLYGLQANNASDLVVENCYAHDIKSSGFVFFGVDGLVLRGCNADWVAADGYKFGGVHNALIESNTGMEHVYASPDAHIDFMQMQGTGVGVANTVFRGNWAIMKTSSFQGIFSSAATNTDVLLEDNIIYTGHMRGISVGGTNITARYNTLIAATDGSGNYVVHKAVYIIDATSHDHNVMSTYPAASGLTGTDYRLQYENSTNGYYYDDYYENASKPVGTLTLEDLRPVPGSPADGEVGAYQRLNELLGN